MDILYISPQSINEITRYCKKELVISVINHFAQNGKIIENKNQTHPNRWWIITDYIKNSTIASRKKLSVILSLAAIGGIIQTGVRQETGDVNVLNMLHKLSYISESDYQYFIDSFYEISQGRDLKFS